MTLQRLAREIEETARQTADMIEEITAALPRLSECPHCSGAETAAAMTQMVRALQAQDRIEQRLRNMTVAVEHLADLAKFAEDTNFDAIWAQLTLDELRFAELPGMEPPPEHGEIEFF